jgi:hypothetical protein
MLGIQRKTCSNQSKEVQHQRGLHQNGASMLALEFDALGEDHGRKTLLEVQASLKLENEPEGSVSIHNGMGGNKGAYHALLRGNVSLVGTADPL